MSWQEKIFDLQRAPSIGTTPPAMGVSFQLLKTEVSAEELEAVVQRVEALMKILSEVAEQTTASQARILELGDKVEEMRQPWHSRAVKWIMAMFSKIRR